ncbi:hypothetical protein FZC75_06565 [Sutcliffiella horikoshii]|uniref:Uncharacterized protein n=1 Tax=Sutcliffiella horikoshii TaxID=79883 RepID=A0A5D4TBU1_9BACI|nr:hypothetical protein FZC75_06565 [Sutcliffiella horikoshii]
MAISVVRRLTGRPQASEAPGTEINRILYFLIFKKRKTPHPKNGEAFSLYSLLVSNCSKYSTASSNVSTGTIFMDVLISSAATRAS